jgi:uncharacterized membrane protein HdeD (DUF308 family)
MSMGFPYFLPSVHEGLHALRRNWGWFLLLGILDVVVGIAAITHPGIATLTAVWFFGILLLIGAGVQFAAAIWGLRWGGFFVHLAVGVLYLFLGVIFLEHTVEAAAFWTLVLAVFFVAGGIIRMVVAVSQQYAAWGWSAFSGFVSLVLGVIVWRQWPIDTVWLIGTLVGIELIFHGWTWIMLALAVRSIPSPATQAPPGVHPAP